MSHTTTAAHEESTRGEESQCHADNIKHALAPDLTKIFEIGCIMMMDSSPADCLWLEDIAQGNKTLKTKDGRSYTPEMKVCIMKLLDDNVSVCREGEPSTRC